MSFCQRWLSSHTEGIFLKVATITKKCHYNEQFSSDTLVIAFNTIGCRAEPVAAAGVQHSIKKTHSNALDPKCPLSRFPPSTFSCTLILPLWRYWNKACFKQNKRQPTTILSFLPKGNRIKALITPATTTYHSEPIAAIRVQRSKLGMVVIQHPYGSTKNVA